MALMLVCSRGDTLSRGVRRGATPVLRLAACAFVLAAAFTHARAETLAGAMAKAYRANPDLGQQRASVRATDENIARQKSGYRPQISATADAGIQATQSRVNGMSESSTTFPRGFGVSVTQTLFNGFRVENGVRAAESSTFGAREQLRNTEQTVLLNVATFYMNVMRDTAILSLRRNNVEVLGEQVRQTRDRFQVGDVTRTDVAQAEAQLAQGQSDSFVADTNLRQSMANYRQVVGSEPKRLDPARPYERGLPKTLEAAVRFAETEHPLIQALLHAVDAAELNVKVIEGELYPTVGVTGAINKRYDGNAIPGSQVLSASVVGQLTVPIYQGGETYARARQAKEALSQQRLQADLQRDQVRAGVVSAWTAFGSSAQVIRASQAQVSAAEIALNGVREEAKVGQRTTLDVLNAQQILLNARVLLVTAQRDRVVNSYGLQSALGRLSVANLKLGVERYDPTVHFNQVKDLWWGLRTPDGQ